MRVAAPVQAPPPRGNEAASGGAHENKMINPEPGLAIWTVVTFLIHVVSEIFRLVSLGVRLFANLLAGHIMILVFYDLIFMLSSVAMIVILAPLIEAGVFAISAFEIFVAAIQAYIFAILTAVYIGGAIQQEH